MSSEAVNIAEGELMIPSIQLHDLDDSKFVRADVVQDGAPFPGTPFTVPNVGGGKYRLIDPVNLTFPDDTFEVEMTLKVYNDAGFTEISKKHGPVEKVYRISNATLQADPTIIQKLDEITNLISQQFFLEGHLIDEEIEGVVIPDEIEGHIEAPSEIEGVVIPDTVEGHIQETEELIGVVQEDL